MTRYVLVLLMLVSCTQDEYERAFQCEALIREANNCMKWLSMRDLGKTDIETLKRLYPKGKRWCYFDTEAGAERHGSDLHTGSTGIDRNNGVQTGFVSRGMWREAGCAFKCKTLIGKARCIQWSSVDLGTMDIETLKQLYPEDTLWCYFDTEVGAERHGTKLYSGAIDIDWDTGVQTGFIGGAQWSEGPRITLCPCAARAIEMWEDSKKRDLRSCKLFLEDSWHVN